MNYNFDTNILGVPSPDQIDGFYGDQILDSFFQSVESSGASRVECKCCKSQLSSLAKRPDRRKHLLSHALLVKDEKIKYFERSQNEPDKLVCRFCRGEYKFHHAFRHVQSCMKKNERNTPVVRKIVVRLPKDNNLNRNEDTSLLHKRMWEEHAGAYYGEEKKLEGGDDKEEETTEKIEKKVKLDNKEFSSLSGREGSSLVKEMYDFISKNKGLDRRALLLKIKEFVEPLEKQFEEQRKQWEEEIEKVKAEQKQDNQENERKIEELKKQIERIESEKKELEKAMKDSEIAIKKEMESEIDQRIEINNTLMQNELKRQVTECLKAFGLLGGQAPGYGSEL